MLEVKTYVEWLETSDKINLKISFHNINNFTTIIWIHRLWGLALQLFQTYVRNCI